MSIQTIDFILHYGILVPLFFLGLFMLLQVLEKRRLLNSFIFNLFLASLAFFMIFAVFVIEKPWLTTLAIGLTLLAFSVFLFFYLFGFFILLWNAYLMWRRESHSLANMLTLLIAIGLVILISAPKIAAVLHIPKFIQTFFATIVTINLFYIPAFFYLFLSALLIYQFNRPRFKQDYIIVLGAGLIDGQRVSPLLASRINRAITFYQRQVKKGRVAPKLVFSGGQGADEKIPEALAMQNYALTQGIPKAQTLVETASKNTFENMQFSKQIIDADYVGQKKPKIIFSTNNYHTFRAGIYARQAGLKADGIGSKVSFYFLPNATIREFLAILLMKKKQLYFVTISSVCLAAFLAIIELIAK